MGIRAHEVDGVAAEAGEGFFGIEGGVATLGEGDGDEVLAFVAGILVELRLGETEGWEGDGGDFGLRILDCGLGGMGICRRG